MAHPQPTRDQEAERNVAIAVRARKTMSGGLFQQLQYAESVAFDRSGDTNVIFHSVELREHMFGLQVVACQDALVSFIRSDYDYWNLRRTTAEDYLKDGTSQFDFMTNDMTLPPQDSARLYGGPRTSFAKWQS